MMMPTFESLPRRCCSIAGLLHQTLHCSLTLANGLHSTQRPAQPVLEAPAACRRCTSIQSCQQASLCLSIRRLQNLQHEQVSIATVAQSNHYKIIAAIRIAPRLAFSTCLCLSCRDEMSCWCRFTVQAEQLHFELQQPCDRLIPHLASDLHVG